jgi:hypothetical protein
MVHSACGVIKVYHRLHVAPRPLSTVRETASHVKKAHVYDMYRIRRRQLQIKFLMDRKMLLEQ